MVRVDFMQTFTQVVEKGSFKRAAKDLGMSISSVSFQINSVEQFYGAKLLKRSVSGVTLTDEGKIALKNMKMVIESIEETKKLISNISGEKLAIASGMVGLYIVPQIQALLKTRYPELEVKVMLRGAHICLDMLTKGEADFAVVGDIPDDVNDRLEVFKLGSDRLMLIVPPDHPLSEGEVTLEDVIKYPFVVLTDDYGITTSLKKALIDSGIDPEKLKIGYVVDDFFSQLHSVSNGLGIAITSIIASCRACEVGLVKARDIKGFRSERSIYFVTTKLAMESERLSEYARFVVENSSRLFSEVKHKCDPMAL